MYIQVILEYLENKTYCEWVVVPINPVEASQGTQMEANGEHA